MRCHICDALLSDEEVQWNRDHKDWDPCTPCKEIIKETAREAGDPEEVVDLGDAYSNEYGDDLMDVDDLDYDDGMNYGYQEFGNN